MSTKHFINDATKLVSDALRSITLTNPAVALDADNKIIYRRLAENDDAPRQVALLAGGGSGHEPAFAGMVGHGMLSCAVAGTVFASPSAQQVRHGLMSRVDPREGVLVIVMNYTGDVLSFGMAVEKAKAAGVSTDMLVVGDDVGVGRARGGKVGRRGMAGTVLVVKVAGALAAQGAPLAEVTRVARATADNLVTVGASLDHVHVPGRDISAAEDGLQAGEVEIGMGIHNEIGSERARIGLPELVRRLLTQLLDQDDVDRAFLKLDPSNRDKLVLLINNLGGVSPLELGGITTEVVGQLQSSYGIEPVRIYSGTFMTSLNGPGFSITLLRIVEVGGAASILELLDASSEAPGWAAPVSTSTWEAASSDIQNGGKYPLSSSLPSSALKPSQASIPSGQTMDPNVERSALVRALERVVAAEPAITEYDTVVGDGDCGIGLKRGAQAVLKHIQETPLTGDVLTDLALIVGVVENTMDGTSGALYAIFLNALVHAFQTVEPGATTPRVWAASLEKSCAALSKYTPARPGDRTLVDALYPFVEVLARTGDLGQAAVASRKAALDTKGMEASLGRSVYVGGSGFTRVPDPGAWGLSCFFLGLAGIEQSDQA